MSRRPVRCGAAALVALVLLLAGCSSGDRPASGGEPFRLTRMTSASGQREVLLQPHGAVRGVVLFMHGFAADQDQILDDDNLFPLRSALLRAHLAVAASQSHGDNVGNPRSVADQVALVSSVTRKLGGRVPVVATVGFSMGGLDALLVAARGIVPTLRSVILLSGVSDTRPFLESRFRGAITRAFGDPQAGALRAAVTAASPFALPSRDFRGKRYLFFHSAEDSVVPEAQSRDMVAKLTAAGIPASFYAVSGDHGELTGLDTGPVVAAVTGAG